MTAPRPLIAGNWKMNGLDAGLVEARAVAAALEARSPAARVPILYGGSVKRSNAADILKLRDVGGALVGGASLKAADFLGIIEAA